MKKIGLILATIGCAASLNYAAEQIAYVKAEGTNRVTAYDSNNRPICSEASMSYQAVKVVGFTSTTFTFGACALGAADCSKESSWVYYVYDTQDCRQIKYWWGK